MEGGQLWPTKEGRGGGSERLVRRWSDRPQFLASTAETRSKLGGAGDHEGHFGMCCVAFKSL